MYQTARSVRRCPQNYQNRLVSAISSTKQFSFEVLNLEDFTISLIDFRLLFILLLDVNVVACIHILYFTWHFYTIYSSQK